MFVLNAVSVLNVVVVERLVSNLVFLDVLIVVSVLYFVVVAIVVSVL